METDFFYYKIKESDTHNNLLSHDRIVSIIAMSRNYYFKKINQSEKDLYGNQLLVSKLTITYINQANTGDLVKTELFMSKLSQASVTFDYMLYSDKTLIAKATTKHTYYSTKENTIKKLSPEVKQFFLSLTVQL